MAGRELRFLWLLKALKSCPCKSDHCAIPATGEQGAVSAAGGLSHVCTKDEEGSSAESWHKLSSLPQVDCSYVLFPTLFIFSFYLFPFLSFAPCSAAALLAFSPPSLATLTADRREELGLLPAPL